MVFVRRRISEPLERISRILVGQHEKLLAVSDERFVSGSRWWGNYGRIPDAATLEISEDEVRDVIRRCRMLRQLAPEKAKQLIGEASQRWLDLLQTESITRIISLPIDSYILHVMVIVCRELDIPVVTISWTPFANRLRFTVFGELSGTSDEPMDGVIDEVLHRFRHEMVRPDWLVGVDAAPWRVAARRALFDSIKPPAFFVYRAISGDWDSFLYSPRSLAKRRMFATLPRFIAANSIEKKAAQLLPEEYAFFPLQFYPESSSDYWIPEAEMHDHQRSVLAVARVVARRMAVVVKEHPAVFGRRSASFLRELRSIPNVSFVPLHANTNSIMRAARLVVGQASTTTFQAQVMGKQVLFFGTPYFSVCSGSAVLRDLAPASVEQAITAITRADCEPSSGEIRAMIGSFVKATGEGVLGGFSPYFERPKQRTAETHVGEDLKKMFAALTAGNESGQWGR